VHSINAIFERQKTGFQLIKLEKKNQEQQSISQSQYNPLHEFNPFPAIILTRLSPSHIRFPGPRPIPPERGHWLWASEHPTANKYI